MKKRFLLLIVILSVFIANDVNAEEIASIEYLNCTNVYYGDIVNDIDASSNDMIINIDNVSFKEINDYYECTFNIKNNSTKEIKITGIDIDENEYLNYDIEYDGDNSVKQYNVTAVKIKVSYSRETTDDINLNNTIKINVGVLNSNGIIENPKTGLLNIFPIFLSIILICLILLLISKKRFGKFKSLILILALLLTSYSTVIASNNNTVLVNNKLLLKAKTAVDTISELAGDADKTSTDIIENVNLAYDGTIDNNLRYIGADPNNYVIFNNELWRIIGVMNNVDDGTGKNESRVKLIRNEFIGEFPWDVSDSTVNSGYGINEWSQADLMTQLNGDYLNSDLAEDTLWYENTKFLFKKYFDHTKVLTKDTQSLIDNAVYYLGGYYQETTQWDTRTGYEIERSSNINTSPSDGVSRTSSWIGKVALMYPSDYGFATDGGINKNREECLLRNLKEFSRFDSYDCEINDWLYEDGYNQWTITPLTIFVDPSAYAAIEVVYIHDDGFVSSSSPGNPYYYYVRPVVYLKSSVKITSGDGSKNNPYKLGL